jgi:adenosylcobinamide kinase/adenosylcobinamide-phosphate guanylyltransferase
MALTVLTGGARSGKSALAVRLARETGADVTVIATAEPRDQEFRDRIAAHRAARPDWDVLEEPVRLERALGSLPGDRCVLLDCLSLWVANLLEHGTEPAAIEVAAERAAQAAATRPGPTIAVTNEVGLGIVPVNPLARRYRDLLGLVNATWVAAADRAGLVVAGRVLPLEPWAAGPVAR